MSQEEFSPSKIRQMETAFLTADGDVISTQGWLWGAVVFTNGTDNLLVELYDGSPGTRKLKVKCKGSLEQSGGLLPAAIPMATSIRAVITGTVSGDAEVMVFYMATV